MRRVTKTSNSLYDDYHEYQSCPCQRRPILKFGQLMDKSCCFGEESVALQALKYQSGFVIWDVGDRHELESKQTLRGHHC